MCLHSKLQLSRATAAPTLFQQNNPLTNTTFNCCTYYLPTDNLWQFPSIPKTEFQCRAEKHGKKWMCWNVHKWNSCGCQIHYTSSVLDSCRDESIVMNCFVEKWLRLEYLLWCCRHLSAAQKKAYARMHPEVCFHIHNPQRSHMKPSCHQRVTGQEKCCPTGPKLIVRFSEASEHHFLCFLPDGCMEQCGIKNGPPESWILRVFSYGETWKDLTALWVWVKIHHGMSRDWACDIAHFEFCIIYFVSHKYTIHFIGTYQHRQQ